jgi:hypothetical protein
MTKFVHNCKVIHLSDDEEKVKVQVKFSIKQAMKAEKGHTGIALLFF